MTKYSLGNMQRECLDVVWANVGKRMGVHLSLLELCHQRKVDLVNVQEPWCGLNTTTQTHPGYDVFAPVDEWHANTYEAMTGLRPRVLTYVKKGAALRAAQRRLPQGQNTRDILWLEINGILFVNVYRAPGTEAALEMVCNTVPNGPTVLGGDFNVAAAAYQPGRANARGGDQLTAWAQAQGMSFTGNIGVPTHRDGGLLDMVFSNLPSTITVVDSSLYTGSDHESLYTTLRTRGAPRPEAINVSVRDDRLPKFAELLAFGMQDMPDPGSAADGYALDAWVAEFTTLWEQVTWVVGTPAGKRDSSAPWWTENCQRLWSEFQRVKRSAVNRADASAEEKAYTKGVRAAKREYWRHRIDQLRDDKDLWNMVGWLGAGPRLRSPPLVINGEQVSEPLAKAEALQREVLGRFSAEDDLQGDPLEAWSPDEAKIPWDTQVSAEEAERSCIGVTSTSPGIDGMTVRLLKAGWASLAEPVRRLYQRCLELGHFPAPWKKAEVAMLPKTGKKDRSSVRSWRPIALLSCIGKGLERLVARRIAWAIHDNGLLSCTHGGALPKRSATDLVCALAHDIEQALARGEEVTLVACDVQGAFDALLHRRLIRKMRSLGFSKMLLRFVINFLSGRQARVRLEGTTTGFRRLGCGTPQGSPLSPILYMLYLAYLVKNGTKWRLAYADDVLTWKSSPSLEENVRWLEDKLRDMHEIAAEEKIHFAAEKTEVIHITKKRHGRNPEIRINGRTVTPVQLPGGRRGQSASGAERYPGMRWLGFWFSRRLDGRRHVAERAAKAMAVAAHLKSFGAVRYGPPAAALRKAAVACVGSSATYAAEAWYNPAHKQRGLLKALNKPLVLAARAILPAYKTTPSSTVLRDAGLPSARVALAYTRLKYGARLRLADKGHPLVSRLRETPRARNSGHSATTLQTAAQLLPRIRRLELRAPRNAPDSRTDPTGGVPKEEAARRFIEWLDMVSPDDIVVYTDGSEKHENNCVQIGYGWAAFRAGLEFAAGSASITPESHVFDAEAIGALKGLQAAAKAQPGARIWICVDSTSVIWGLRGDAPRSSQWAFLEFHDLVDLLRKQGTEVRVRWCPGHQGIPGNDRADELAKAGSAGPPDPDPRAQQTTYSGAGTVLRAILSNIEKDWWRKELCERSPAYREWKFQYTPRKEPEELRLPRPLLGHYLAMRTGHGDFKAYHDRFNHQDANTSCAWCWKRTSPEHPVHCRYSRAVWRNWPWPNNDRPAGPPNRAQRWKFFQTSFGQPKSFEAFSIATNYFSARPRAARQRPARHERTLRLGTPIVNDSNSDEE